MVNQQNDVRYIADLYIRLSDEDEREGLSGSCESQEMLLKDYCFRHNIFIHKIHIDDGWSGTNFERPGFKEVEKDIASGCINTVIVKDLSRLGRENIETGLALKEFDEKGIYFIAVLDNVDTRLSKADRIMVPFKNLVNSLYPQDVSDKVKFTFRGMADKGYFFGSMKPYGYKLDPLDKHHLVIDEEVAWVVKKIYQLYLDGIGFGKIAKALKDEKILTPSEYYFRKYGTSHCRKKSKYRSEYDWHLTTVRTILMNSVYTGEIVNGKSEPTKLGSRKSKKLPKDRWIRRPNMHEAIIPKETFDKVQYMIEHKARMTNHGHAHIFAGLVKCADCGSALNLGGREGTFTCYTYKTFGKDKCPSHYIRMDVLKEIVTSDIRKKIELLKKDETTFVKMILKHKNQMLDYEVPTELYQKKQVKRLEEIRIIKEKMYEDYALGRMDMATYERLRMKYLDEEMRLEMETNQYLQSKKKVEREKEGIRALTITLKQYLDFEELTSDMTHDLIEKIVIHQAEILDKKRVQKVDIYYRFTGMI